MIAICLVAFFFTLSALLFALLCCRRAADSMQNTVGAVYAQSPEAAELLLNTLLTRQSGDGLAAAERLGLTGRAYDFYLQALYPSGFVLAGLVLLSVAAAVLALVLIRTRRAERAARECLTRRVLAVIAAEAPFHPQNAEETLYAQLADELCRVRALSDARAQEQRVFVENVAHEIKTPAAGLLLTLELMEQSGATPERLQRAQQSVERIRGYVAELLTLARMRSSRLRFAKEPVELNELLEELLRRYPEVQRTDQTASFPVLGDRTRLSEAVENLLRNALRHSPPDCSPTLSLEAVGGQARIRVSNAAAGELPETERYVVGKEDGSSTGIGLSLSRETAKRHYGTLTISAREDGGVNADLLLPRYRLKNSPV